MKYRFTAYFYPENLNEFNAMRLKFPYLLLLLGAVIIAVSACKTKKGAGSANVRTLSLKSARSYYLSFAGKKPEDNTISTKELASANNIKIMLDGKEAKDINLQFTCTIIKTSGESAQMENSGRDFSSDIKEQLKTLQSGDKFSFENIHILDASGQDTTYPTISFEVK